MVAVFHKNWQFLSSRSISKFKGSAKRMKFSPLNSFYFHNKSWMRSKPFFKFIVCVLIGGWLILKVLAPRTGGENSTENAIDSRFSEDFFDRMESRMIKRKKMVEEVCKREGLGKYLNVDSLKTRHYPPTPNYEFLYFDLSNNLVWCPIYKSASTSWLYNFCNLAGISDDYLDNTNILIAKIARKNYPIFHYEDAKREINNNKLKFFIVRHPFERLLSAYRDKLEKVVFRSPQRHETEFYYEKYGKRIVSKYRTKNLTSQAQSGSAAEVGKSVGIEPTFREFVTYLADLDLSRQAEEHWIPYYLYCTPCFIDYDIIAKFETLYEDQVFIIAKSNLQDKISPKWKRLTKGGRTSYVAEKYYSTLSKELLLKLYDKYKLDFDMFDYNLDEYLNYAQ